MIPKGMPLEIVNSRILAATKQNDCIEFALSYFISKKRICTISQLLEPT